MCVGVFHNGISDSILDQFWTVGLTFYLELFFQNLEWFSDTFATVIDSGLAHIDVINVTGGTFQLNEEIVRGELFSALIQSVTLLNTETIFEFGESITNLEGDTAIIEETNIDEQGVISDRIVVSKTSGTPRFETGIFDLRLI